MSEERFAGVSCGAGGRRLTVAVLDSLLEVMELRSMPLGEAADLLSVTQRMTVAVCAPLPGPRRAAARVRAADRLLRERGLPVYPARAHAGWMLAGKELARRLAREGFRAGRAPRKAGRWMIETPAAACFAALLGRPPYPRGALEGRLQRQLLLNEARVRIADAMDVLEELTAHHILAGRLNLSDLRSPDELDALAAGFTARQAALNHALVEWIGSDAEGWLCLPSSQGWRAEGEDTPGI